MEVNVAQPATVLPTRLLFWADATAIAPWLVLVRPSHAADAPLLAHEQVHCAQMRRTGWLRFVWRYATQPAFRRAMELEAYRAQLALQPSALRTLAGHLADDYRLGLSLDQAIALLTAPAAPAS